MIKNLIATLVVGFSVVACTPSSPHKEKEDVQKISEVQQPKTGAWTVIYHKDEMRNKETRWLGLESENSANLDFPYDGANFLTMEILDSKTNNPRIFFTIDKGQYDCGNYGCAAAVKFGSTPVQEIELREFDTTNTKDPVLIFSGNSEAFLSNIRRFDEIIIEIPFYRDGTRQFKFLTTGFNEAEKGI